MPKKVFFYWFFHMISFCAHKNKSRERFSTQLPLLDFPFPWKKITDNRMMKTTTKKSFMSSTNMKSASWGKCENENFSLEMNIIHNIAKANFREIWQATKTVVNRLFGKFETWCPIGRFMMAHFRSESFSTMLPLNRLRAFCLDLCRWGSN